MIIFFPATNSSQALPTSPTCPIWYSCSTSHLSQKKNKPKQETKIQNNIEKSNTNPQNNNRKKKQSTQKPCNPCLLAIYSWACGLTLSVYDFLSNTWLEKIDFPFHSTLQVQIASFLWWFTSTSNYC